MPTTPPPMIITVAAATPGTPPSRMPRPPSGFSSMKAPACVAILPAISLIGASSGSRPSRVLDGLVGDAGRARLAQARGQLGVGREVQVGEQRLARAAAAPTSSGCGSFTFRTISASREHRLGVGHDARALGLVVVVGDRAALAGAGLDQHLVAALGQLAHAGRA